MGPVFLSALIALPSALAAQGQASVGIGVGTVRHTGGSSFSAATLSPAAQLLTPSLYLGAGGAVSILEGGVWAEQGRADLWAAFPRGRLSGTRIAVSATIAGSTRSDGVPAGAGAALAELVWGVARGGAAVGIGGAGGVIESAPPVGAFRLRARSWWQPRESSVQLSLSVEGTRFFGAWYTDLVGGATLEEQRLVASLWASARVSTTYGSTGAASATFQYFVTPSIALEASGGSYLRDPFQGLPRAGFGSGGVRVFTAPRSPPPATSPAIPTGLTPLVAQHRGGGDTVVVRFRMDSAHSVAIAGSWNAWTPVPLRGLGADIWEAALVLPPGTYYFNLVVDGQEWVVPGGVAVVSDGMGGLVAVLTVL